MMSSCCTLRLKRRSAFSRDSPSCSLTSANGLTPPNSSHLDGIVIARFSIQVKNYNHVTQEKRGLQHETAQFPPSENQFQSDLHLTGSIGVGGSQEVRRPPVLSREVIDSSLVIYLNELAGSVQETVITELDALVVTVEQVERFGHQVELHSITNIQTARQAHVGGGVIRAQECIASGSGKTIVGNVAVLIGITENFCIHRSTAADGHDPGHLPIVEDPAEKCVMAAEGARVGNPGERKTMPLIGDAGAAFGAGGIGILYCYGASGDQRIWPSSTA